MLLSPIADHRTSDMVNQTGLALKGLQNTSRHFTSSCSNENECDIRSRHMRDNRGGQSQRCLLLLHSATIHVR